MMEMEKPLVTISIPVLNEEGNIQGLYNRLVSLAARMRDRCELEFLFSDNHSVSAQTSASSTDVSDVR